MKVLAIVFACVALCAAAPRQDGPKCLAPNGGGLMPVLEEFAEMIPMESILEILLTHMTSDPETQSVMEFLSSGEFKAILDLVTDQPAFNELVKFACYEVYFDAIYYINFLNGILGFPELPGPRIQHIRVAQRAGFNAMLEEILALIPTEKMQALLEEKLNSDYYVQLAFQKINSDEFGTLIETLQGNAAYGDMKNRLRALGVDIDAIIETVGKIFRP